MWRSGKAFCPGHPTSTSLSPVEARCRVPLWAVPVVLAPRLVRHQLSVAWVVAFPIMPARLERRRSPRPRPLAEVVVRTPLPARLPVHIFHRWRAESTTGVPLELHRGSRRHPGCRKPGTSQPPSPPAPCQCQVPGARYGSIVAAATGLLVYGLRLARGGAAVTGVPAAGLLASLHRQGGRGPASLPLRPRGERPHRRFPASACCRPVVAASWLRSISDGSSGRYHLQVGTPRPL
jgi:hypothetical protein